MCRVNTGITNCAACPKQAKTTKTSKENTADGEHVSQPPVGGGVADNPQQQQQPAAEGPADSPTQQQQAPPAARSAAAPEMCSDEQWAKAKEWRRSQGRMKLLYKHYKEGNPLPEWAEVSHAA